MPIPLLPKDPADYATFFQLLERHGTLDQLRIGILNAEGVGRPETVAAQERAKAVYFWRKNAACPEVPVTPLPQ
ncbi:hypothetical protein [Paracoccus xiamenensis]|uniref:hypothetical protein n=1 Tax=Paracoccus xiamenensis TaxID=2714901 RepID=UPI001409C736|nr:hypothetical protein [Paracoccus xiamenensis]NHF73116.1 hypothetical protein [Paracoccus xiamenensis]